MSEVVRFRLPHRDCYACFDFERSGPLRCVVCSRPYGRRLPEAGRPKLDAGWWIDNTPEPPTNAA